MDRRDKVVATPVVLPYSGWPGVVELREILVVVETDRRRVGHPAIVQALHSEHMQQRLKQQRRVTRGQHETIAIGPQGIGGIVTQEILPQRVGYRRHRRWRAWMAGISLLHGINGQRPDGIDAELIVIWRRGLIWRGEARRPGL